MEIAFSIPKHDVIFVHKTKIKRNESVLEEYQSSLHRGRSISSGPYHRKKSESREEDENLKTNSANNASNLQVLHFIHILDSTSPRPPPASNMSIWGM